MRQAHHGRDARGARRAALEARRLYAFASAVRQRFPGCPPGEEHAIARFAMRRNTARVARAATVLGYFDEAVDLAVVAHARHRFTRYEALLASGASRERARDETREEVSAVLAAWARAGGQGEG